MNQKPSHRNSAKNRAFCRRSQNGFFQNDIRTKFEQSRSSFFSLISLTVALTFACSEPEQSAVRGVSETEIVIGAYGPQTGPAAPYGAVVRGVECAFKMVNEDGGIAGRKVRVILRDDGYQPARTKAVVKEMVERDGVFMVMGGVGTACGMAVKDYLIEQKTPFLFPSSGSPMFAFPPNRYVFSGVPPYCDEAAILTQHAVETLGKTKVGIIYQNDDFGKTGLVGAQLELEQHGAELVEAVSVEVMDSDLSSHALKLKDAGAEAVLLYVINKHAAILLSESAKIGFSPTWLASVPLSNMPLMHEITSGRWEDVIFATYYELPDSKHPRVQKYRTARDKFMPEERWDSMFMAGFVFTNIIVDAIEQCGEELTQERFVDALETVKNKEALGVKVTFNGAQRQGHRSVKLIKCTSREGYEQLTDFVTSDIDINEAMRRLRGRD